MAASKQDLLRGISTNRIVDYFPKVIIHVVAHIPIIPLLSVTKNLLIALKVN